MNKKEINKLKLVYKLLDGVDVDLRCCTPDIGSPKELQKALSYVYELLSNNKIKNF